ncbi:hypothetical protein KAFR_0B01910 [Kazachstania africana CBS 2517]|uniref:Uncharacterized protein n=1 Tax=Kazachstania africana (strain ATCC 22294 / BCRC 22015 / CBS 2517 / CECT 1963 / NBRC 1671 / NRRL Y-8276) TaxID=1071382 RepID=H2AQ40_KAZAF|nr:hypothetical protein KAFR_0B01910 [Kazachstania africana CBS 2517]CCF56490.1 hypothetical protein KAFR_0B01910 [Kazachstania africana CBS 2517]
MLTGLSSNSPINGYSLGDAIYLGHDYSIYRGIDRNGNTVIMRAAREADKRYMVGTSPCNMFIRKGIHYFIYPSQSFEEEGMDYFSYNFDCSEESKDAEKIARSSHLCMSPLDKQNALESPSRDDHTRKSKENSICSGPSSKSKKTSKIASTGRYKFAADIRNNKITRTILKVANPSDKKHNITQYEQACERKETSEISYRENERVNDEYSDLCSVDNYTSDSDDNSCDEEDSELDTGDIMHGRLGYYNRGTPKIVLDQECNLKGQCESKLKAKTQFKGQAEKITPILNKCNHNSVQHVLIESPMTKIIHVEHKQLRKTPIPKTVKKEQFTEHYDFSALSFNGKEQTINRDALGKSKFELNMVQSSMLKRRGLSKVEYCT